MKRLVALVFVAGCAAPLPTPARVPNEQPRVIDISLDFSFDVEERAAVVEAAQRLTLQSRGWLSVVVLGDFGQNFHVPPGTWRVLDTPESDWTVEFDRILGGRRVLGWVNDESLDIHLVTSRMWTREILVHVAEHEIMHAAGAAHTSDPQGVMSPGVGAMPPVNLSPADEAEIRRAVLRR